MSVEDAIYRGLVSHEVRCGDAEANVVDVINDLSKNARRIAEAVTPFSASGGTDASGGYVASLTEAMMGVTSGLVMIAEAIESLAEATRVND